MFRLRSAFAATVVALALGAPAVIARAQDQGAQMGGPSMPSQQGSPDTEGNAAPSPSGAIQFPNIPRITLQALPGYGPAPLMVGFLVMNANPESAPLVSYRWSFGDGKISTLPPTVLFHIYATPGTYTVTVTATTADGQNASGFAGITVTQAAN